MGMVQTETYWTGRNLHGKRIQGLRRKSGICACRKSEYLGDLNPEEMSQEAT